MATEDRHEEGALDDTSDDVDRRSVISEARYLRYGLDVSHSKRRVESTADDTFDDIDRRSVISEAWYFVMRENAIKIAVAMATDELKVSNLKGYWVLTEIDHWSFEQEKLVLLSNNSIIVCNFNFRFKYLKESRRISLQSISAIQYGNPVYPSRALLWPAERKQAVKLCQGNSEAGFFQRWNPFSSDVPYRIFELHILKKGKAKLLTICTYKCKILLEYLKKLYKM